MKSVYISSTYEDLKDYRQPVADVLRDCGYNVDAMEKYPARDDRPKAQVRPTFRIVTSTSASSPGDTGTSRARTIRKTSPSRNWSILRPHGRKSRS